MLLQFNRGNIKTTVNLPGSKSISNRLLILQHVLQIDLSLHNLSGSKDTKDLLKALTQIKEKKHAIIDIGHAGTDMRFLTALLSITSGSWTITGSQRMKERPIKQLVDALRSLGAEIIYGEKENYPPLIIKGKRLEGGEISIDGSISSQFISALLLIAPSFENGLRLHLQNKIVSGSYIQLTIDILKEFNVRVEQTENIIEVKHFSEQRAKEKTELTVESDWSAASYWYAIAALSERCDITLNSLNKNSSQGDSKLPEIYTQFGVKSEFLSGAVRLSKAGSTASSFQYDFTDCPDIAQTVAVTCLALNIPCYLTGLSTLRHKETDRLTAMKTELEKAGGEVSVTDTTLKIHSVKTGTKRIKIKTYDDHRMAMSFAPLCIKQEIEIEDPEVVIKSYPEFWEHLKAAGIECRG